MSIFSKKKRETGEKQLSAPPKFPEMEEIRSAIKPVSEAREMPFSPLPPPPMIFPASLPASSMPKAEEREYPIAAMPSFSQPVNMPETREIYEPARKRVTEESYDMGRKKPKEPIYVKIEHFKAALADFEGIKQQLQDSFEILEKIKATRAEEQEKLGIWEKEIESIKEKVAELDEKLFSKVEE